MNLLLLVVAAVAAVSAPRARPRCRATDARAAAEGALVVLAAAALLAALAGPLADSVDLADATVRMSAGAVLAAQGIAAMLLPLPRSEPRLAGRSSALVPVAFPTLLTPAVGLLAISGSLDRSAPTTVGALLLALATVPLLALLVPRPSPRAMRALGAGLGAVLVVTGIGLVFNGIYDI